MSQTELTATAGTVTINFDNPASLSHDVVIEDDAGSEIGKTDLISAEHDLDRRSTCSPGPTRTSATCRATARAAWRAR